LQAAAALIEIFSFSADCSMKTKPSPQAFSPTTMQLKF
jgi:hypothetical protein